MELSILDRGYYIETIDNITDEAVQKHIKEQVDESRKEDSSSTALWQTCKRACDTALWGEQKYSPLEG